MAEIRLKSQNEVRTVSDVSWKNILNRVDAASQAIHNQRRNALNFREELPQIAKFTSSCKPPQRKRCPGMIPSLVSVHGRLTVAQFQPRLTEDCNDHGKLHQY